MPSHPGEAGRSQRGVTLIWMTIFLMFMLMFIALGVDMAKYMTTRTQLQNAADAAALAGAGAYMRGGASVDSAVAGAVETGGYNQAYEAGQTPVVVDPADVVVDTDKNTVTVTTRREGSTAMVVQFLQVMGMKTLEARAIATAKVVGGCNLIPVAGRPDPGPGFVDNCTEYQLKLGGGSGIQGSYGLLDFSQIPCSGDQCTTPQGGQQGGGIGIRCRVADGFPCCIDSAAMPCVPTETGGSCGNSAAGIHDRFLLDTDQRDLNCWTDYTGNNMRYVIIPITDPPTGSGSNACFPLRRYGRFFLTKDPTHFDQCIIYANFREYLRAGGPSTGNYRVYLVR